MRPWKEQGANEESFTLEIQLKCRHKQDHAATIRPKDANLEATDTGTAGSAGLLTSQCDLLVKRPYHLV